MESTLWELFQYNMKNNPEPAWEKLVQGVCYIRGIIFSGF